jgi:hydrogenase nickel incorporation protein HypA/HybF
MHELPVTESILEIALRYAGQAEAHRITDIYIVIGQLASIVDDSVQFYWDIISADTIAAGARLHFERTPAEMLCLNCQATYHPDEGELACPACGSRQVQVISGEEFRMEAIEVETREEAHASDARRTG